MKKFGSKLFSLLLCTAVLCAVCFFPAAADDDYWVNPKPELQITRKDMDPIKPGEEFTLTVSMSYTNSHVSVQSPRVTFDPSEAFMIVDATPTKSIDNFKRSQAVSASIKLKALNEITNPVQSVKVTVNFSYDQGSAGLGSGSCSETVYIPVVTSGSAAGAPAAVITRSDIATIRAGQEFTMDVSIKNTGKAAMEQPILSVTPGAGLSLMDATMSRQLGSIQPGASLTVPVKLKAPAELSAASLPVDLKLSYTYPGGNGTADQTVYIPADPASAAANGAPVAVITRGDVAAVSANQEFTLNISVKNEGKTAMEKPMLSVSPDSGLALMDATMSRLLDNIQPGGSVTVPVKLKARSELSSPSLRVDLELSYNYAGGSGSASQAVYIPAVVTEKPENTGGSTWTFATPNIILSQYHYGDDVNGEVLSVAAGSTFDLNFEFENTSSIFTVENIVVTVSPGEGFCIASGSDTAHYPNLAAGATQEQLVSIQAQPTAKTGAAKIDIRFNYEYVENSVRKNVNLSQTISIPIYQPDRFEVEMPQLPDMVDTYNEMYISMPFVNKGKSEVSNIRAEIISEDGAVTSINPVQNLGNFQAGQSGTIDFIFSPQMPGEVSFSFRITYEDPNAQEKVLEFPVTMMVNEPYYPGFDDPGVFDPGFIDEPTEQKSGIPWWVWAASGAVVLAAGIIVIVKVKKKRKKASGELSDFTWDDPSADFDNVGGKK